MRFTNSARYSLSYSSSSLRVASLDTTRPLLKSFPLKCSVMSARFHPLSDDFILILTPISLVAFQIRVVDGPDESLALVVIDTLSLPPLSSSVSAFCFGSNRSLSSSSSSPSSFSWSVFSIILLCNDGTLYSIDSWLPPSLPVPMALLDELRAEISSRPDDHQTDDLLSWLTSCFIVCENDPSYCLYSKSQGGGRREGGGRDFSGSSLSQFNYEYLPVISGPLLVHGPEFKDTQNREFCDIAVTSFKLAHCIEIVTRSNRVISLANLSSVVSLPMIEKQRSKHVVGSFSPTLTSLQIHSPRDEFVVISAIELQSTEDERTIEDAKRSSALSDLKNPYFLQHAKAPSILMLISLSDVFSLDLVFLQSVNDLIERNGGILKNKRHKDKNDDDDNDDNKDEVSKFTIEVGTNPFRNNAVNTNQVLIVSSTVFSAVLIEFVTTGKDGFATIRSGFTSLELLESLKSETNDHEEGTRLEKNHTGVVVSSMGTTFDEEIEKKRVLRSYFQRRGAHLAFNDNKALLTSASTEEDVVALAIIEEAAVIRAAQATHFPLTPSMDSFLKTVEEMKDLNVRIAASKEKAGSIETRLVKLISAQLCQLKDVEAALYALRLRKMETRDKN